MRTKTVYVYESPEAFLKDVALAKHIQARFTKLVETMSKENAEYTIYDELSKFSPGHISDVWSLVDLNGKLQPITIEFLKEK